MKILVLNGSPRANGNTKAMINAFAEGAESAGHQVNVVNVCQKDIGGCKACEYCHTKGNGKCIQQDDMQEVYQALTTTDMIVFASPIYYWNFSGQLQNAISRLYALGKPANVKKCALILSSGSNGVYEGAIYSYTNSFPKYLGMEDMGIFTAYGSQNKSEAKLQELKEFGQSLK